MKHDKPVVVAISGASGAIYGIRLVKALVDRKVPVLIILSDGGLDVLAHELGYDEEEQDFIDFLKDYGVQIDEETDIDVFFEEETASAPASGSFVHGGMVVCPCSMKTLAAVSCGIADNLLNRSADVSLKENRPLILVPRETPFNLIHLENLVRVKKAGAVIMPACPSFYLAPESIEELVDSVIARILDHLNIPHQLLMRWGN